MSLANEFAKCCFMFTDEFCYGQMVLYTSHWTHIRCSILLSHTIGICSVTIYQVISDRLACHHGIELQLKIFADRLSKGEEILFFCFYVLKFFHSDEYCTIADNRRVTKNSVSSSSSSSVCVLRTDSGGDVENMFSEVESTGSNLSLNSMESGRSHNDSTSHSEVFIECSNGWVKS